MEGRAEYYLDCAKSGKDPFAGMVSGVQPTFKDRWPASALQIRAAEGRLRSTRCGLTCTGRRLPACYWDGQARLECAATNDGMIHISRPADSIGMGEIAILDTLPCEKALFSHEDRVVVEQAGAGGFHFATFLPDASRPLFTHGRQQLQRAGRQQRLRCLHVAGESCNLPFLLWDTPGDGHCKANHAFADALRANALKFPGCYPNLELTDRKAAYGVIDRKLQDEGWAWMNKQVRNRYRNK
jgi:hypothetical protein